MADNNPLKSYHAYRSSDFKISRRVVKASVMSKEITKIRMKSFTDDDLLEEIKKATRIDPPQNSVAVVVDVVESQGAIRIFERKDDSYVNGVGTEEAGHMVIVPWNSGWWFRVSGSIRVGYAVANNVK
ncbi:predicted protein [Histoplasma capsulatum H143]|uniref:Uncharacterized protein n=1 Tax=Ajellomyces capsulatus (strain H143) TaxID=544712 RepID=C6H5U8_AJECH|nr:predicted protein [Histoplasma capsulatum H143]